MVLFLDNLIVSEFVVNYIVVMKFIYICIVDGMFVIFKLGI